MQRRIQRSLRNIENLARYLPDALQYGVSVQWPEMVVKDVTKYAQALQQVTMAASLAIDKGLLTKDKAIALIEAIASGLGVSFDAAVELEAINTEQAEAEVRDLFDTVDTVDTEDD